VSQPNTPSCQVALFATCLGDLYFPHVCEATVNVLSKIGVNVEFPDEQTCCGQPAFNSGFQKVTRDFALHFLKVFEHAEFVVSPFGSCVSLVKNEYVHLFDDAPALSARVQALADRTHELATFLVDVMGIGDLGAEYHTKATYHDGCHTLRGLKVEQQPRTLLSHVKGLELVEMELPAWCCGFGGTFSVRMPDVSGAMLDEKIRRVQNSAVPVIISTELGCMMQIHGGLARKQMPQRVVHLANVLAGDVQ